MTIKTHEVVPCPQCSGHGEIPKPTPTPGAAEIRIKSPELAFLEGKLKSALTGLEGWRGIASALLAVAFGNELRGFGEVPPVELLAAVEDRSDDNATVCALRDALIGRAWRVRGKEGSGTCDYPLCPHRREKRPLTAIPATFNVDPVNHIVTDSATATRITMNVCIGTGGECEAWARWVSARARAGTIQSR